MVRARVLNTDAKNGNDPVVPGVNVNGKWFPEIVISHRFSKIKNIAVELAPVVPRKHEVKLNGAKSELLTKHLPPLRMLHTISCRTGRSGLSGATCASIPCDTAQVSATGSDILDESRHPLWLGLPPFGGVCAA